MDLFVHKLDVDVVVTGDWTSGALTRILDSLGEPARPESPFRRLDAPFHLWVIVNDWAYVAAFRHPIIVNDLTYRHRFTTTIVCEEREPTVVAEWVSRLSGYFDEVLASWRQVTAVAQAVPDPPSGVAALGEWITAYALPKVNELGQVMVTA